MSSYAVRVYVWEDGKYLQRSAQYAGFTSPMDAMKRLSEEFERAGGYGTTAWAECIDEESGISQWIVSIG